MVVLQGQIGSVGFQGPMGFPGPQVKFVWYNKIMYAADFIIRWITLRPQIICNN